MTDLSQLEVNVRLAELLGWKCINTTGEHAVGFDPAITAKGEPAVACIARVPRFCSSLDECAKVEAGLTDEQRHEYFERYLPAFSGAQTRDQGPLDFALFAGATARQRAEALIATLQP